MQALYEDHVEEAETTKQPCSVYFDDNCNPFDSGRRTKQLTLATWDSIKKGNSTLVISNPIKVGKLWLTQSDLIR